jgi:hypothetical protein
VTLGVDTIKYSVTNSCGTSAVKLPIDIHAVAGCTELGIGTPGNMPMEIEVYPNPVTNELNISGLQSADKIRLTDIVGKQVGNSWEPGNGAIQSFSTGNLPPGLYILQVWDENGFMKKIVKVVKE